MKRSAAVLLMLFFMPLCLVCSLEAGERVRLVFTGDIMAHKEQIDAARRKGAPYDFAPQFRRVAPLFDRALVTGNLETVFAGERAVYSGYPAFNTPDELAEAIAAAGIRVVTLANNHILDRRERGAARTIDVLDAAGLLWTGLSKSAEEAGSPLVVEYEGVRAAFLNYSYGSNAAPSAAVSRDVFMNIMADSAVLKGLSRAESASCDLTVVCLHWGNEYQFTPANRSRAVADMCLKGGADIVIGTHPHVLQPIEVRSADGSPKLVAWSLGNFVSNQRTEPRERSVVLAVDVEKDADAVTRIKRVAVAPTWVSSTRSGGRRKFEVVYAGTGSRFNHAGLPASELSKARAAGKFVLEFLGARGDPDDEGFYTLWDAVSPDVLPAPGRKSPTR
jgi:poly-gamma-glutamate synthesis protein (capsule biosynthesis protein)